MAVRLGYDTKLLTLVCQRFARHVMQMLTSTRSAWTVASRRSAKTTYGSCRSCSSRPRTSGASTIAKGFPAGALVVSTTFDVGSSLYKTRRASRQPVVVNAEGGAFSAENLLVTMVVPCNTSQATLIARLDLFDPGDGSRLASPPDVEITTPSLVTCGTPTAVDAAASDPDDDLTEIRWKVDGVLIDAGTTALTFTGQHVIEATARDARGASSTARKAIQCN